VKLIFKYNSPLSSLLLDPLHPPRYESGLSDVGKDVAEPHNEVGLAALGERVVALKDGEAKEILNNLNTN
jgi:hypothetical protein